MLMHLLRAIVAPVVLSLLVSGGNAAVVAQGPTGAGGLARLVHPEIAEQLGLDDQQRVALQQLLQQRAGIAAAAEDPEQKAKLAEIDKKVRETLTDEQWKKWQETPADNRLMFQFRDQKWEDVLQWFAEQEGLTLVMNQTPPGTFTYTDTRSYSPSEAIDLLNSVLLTRGYTLVRREKMLTLLQLSSTIPIELLPEVKLTELPSRGRFELIRVHFPLGGRPIDAVLKEVEPYLGPYGRALPLAQSRQLMVIENAGKMETINVLINTVPEPKAPPKPDPPAPPPAPVFASYPLGDLDPQAALETVKKLVASERITIDEKTRLMNAYVVPAEQTAIQSVLEQMQAKLTAMDPVSVVAYQIEGTAEEGLVEQLQVIAPRAKVTADSASGRILVTASTAEHGVIAEALKAIGIEPVENESRNVSVQSFQLSGTEATTVGTALQAMLPKALVLSNPTLGTVVVRGSEEEVALASSVIERWQGTEDSLRPLLQSFPLPRPAPATWIPSVTKVVPGAELWIDTEENKLMFLGTEKERALLEKSLPQLLTLIPEEPKRVLKTYRLKAEELERWQALQSTLQTEIPQAQMIVSATNAEGETELWVWGEEEDQQQVESLLSQVREAIPAEEIRWPRVYSFEKRNPAIVRQWITQQHPGTKIELLSEADSFTVWATEAVHTELEATLPTLREQLPEPPVMAWKGYSAGNISVTELKALVTPLLTGADGTVTARMTADATGKRLLVEAPDSVHEEIARFIETLTQPLPADEELILLAYTLANADATAVKALLEQAIPGITIVVDTTRNQFVATATLMQHGRIKGLLAEIDSPESGKVKPELRTYQLNELNASTLVATLTSMWPKMTFTVDTVGNRILATGSLLDHESLQQTIDRLNQASKKEGLRVETYQVPQGNLVTLPTVLAQIAPKALISTDTINRVIVVWGEDGDHQRISKAIEQLRKTSEGKNEVAVYTVPRGQGLALRTTLLTMFPSVSIAIDTAGSQLTVLAPKEIQTQIVDVIKKSEEAAAAVPETVPKRYEVPAAMKTSVSTLLATRFPAATVLTSPADDVNGLLIAASEGDQQAIGALVEQIVAELKPEEKDSIVVYTLERVEPAAFQFALAGRVPEARLIGTATKTPIVLGTVEEHSRVAALVTELEDAFKALRGRELKVYSVRDDLFAQVTAAIPTVVPDATLVSSGTATDRVLLIASEKEHERFGAWLAELKNQIPEPTAKQSHVFPLKYADPTAAYLTLSRMLPTVSFAVDTVGKTVSAVLDEEDVKRVEDFITQYDVQRESPMVAKTYALKTADALSLYRAIAAMVPTAQVVPEVAGNRLIVTASPKDQERITTVIAEMDSTEGAAKTVRGYALTTAGVTGVLTTLQTAFPKVTIAADATNGGLVVAASEEDHKEIASLIKELDTVFAAGKEVQTRVFPLQNAPATSALLMLQRLLPKSTVAGDTISKTVAVTGSVEDLAKAEQFVRDFDVERNELQETRAFALKKTNATSVARSLALMVPDGSVVPELTSNQVIVTASEEDLARVATIIEQVDGGETGEKTIRSYAVETGGVTGLQTTLQSTFPQATVASDSVNGIVTVAATDEEHAQIRALVDELNAAPPREPQLKIYRLAYADSAAVADAVDNAFGWRSGVGVSADVNSNTVFVLALPRQHEVAQQVIDQMDREDAGVSQRKLRKYAMAGIDGSEVAEAVETLFENSRPEVDVRYDFINEQLVVVASESQLTMVEETLQQFEPPSRELEIFTLEENDPARVRDAIDALFEDIAYSDLPSITLDEDRQQVFVRATAEQLVEIRELLTRLGETNLSGPASTKKVSGSARLRTMNVGRASDELLQRLIEAWPQMRGNPLRVMSIESNPDGARSGDATKDNEPEGAGAENANGDRGGDRGAQLPLEPAGGNVLVSTQAQGLGAQELGTQESRVASQPDDTSEQPAVIVIPGVGRWTIVSSDVEALDAIEQWLQGIVMPPIEAAVSSGNHSVYVLQHADATDLEDVLSSLFRRSERSSIASGRSSTQIVADRRTNSLIVSGSRSDRGVIEELLSVLDSPEMIDALEAAVPELIPVLHAEADDVEDLLRSVYAAQLSSGGARPQLTIPQGISEEVATMLRQLNAATRGPLLTLSVDGSSNSIVIRAPAELSEEIRTFIQRIDEQAVSSTAARIRIIPLQGGNARQIGEVLENFRPRRGAR